MFTFFTIGTTDESACKNFMRTLYEPKIVLVPDEDTKILKAHTSVF